MILEYRVSILSGVISRWANLRLRRELFSVFFVDVTDELLISLFREYGVCCMNVETNYEYPMPKFDSMGFAYCSSMGNSTTNLEIHNSNRFIKCLSDYMMEWRSHNYVKL